MPAKEKPAELSRSEKAAQRRVEREARRMKKRDVSNTATIKLLVEKNPRREGSAPYAHFEKYEDGMSVETLLSKEVGGEWIHLQADIQRGYIELAA